MDSPTHIQSESEANNTHTNLNVYFIVVDGSAPKISKVQAFKSFSKNPPIHWKEALVVMAFKHSDKNTRWVRSTWYICCIHTWQLPLVSAKLLQTENLCTNKERRHTQPTDENRKCKQKSGTHFMLRLKISVIYFNAERNKHKATLSVCVCVGNGMSKWEREFLCVYVMWRRMLADWLKPCLNFNFNLI